MSGDTPWWYSGTDEPSGEEPLAGEDALAGQAQAEGQAPADDRGASGRDWTTLVFGAQRIVDWATERVLAPHAEHDDPREHPDCVVCRTMTVLGDVGLRSPQPSDDSESAGASGSTSDPAGSGVETDRFSSGAIRWIPIRGESREP